MAGEDLYNVKGDQEHIDEEVRDVVRGVRHEREYRQLLPYRDPELVVRQALVSLEVLACIRPRVIPLD